jgi:hypothetical protein
MPQTILMPVENSTEKSMREDVDRGVMKKRKTKEGKREREEEKKSRRRKIRWSYGKKEEAQWKEMTEVAEEKGRRSRGRANEENEKRRRSNWSRRWRRDSKR